MTNSSELLAAQLRRDGTRPLFTYYDAASGERVELSVATTANWVAKTAGYLSDELGVDEGDLVSVILPLHWQAAVILLAAWSTGATVGFEAGGMATVTSDPVAADDATVVLSLAPMGADFSRLVAAYPDDFIALAPGGGDLVDAAPVDIPHGARVLTVVAYDAPDAIGYGLIGPLAVDGSVVMVRNPDHDALPGLAATERVTHTLGVDVDGLPRLGGQAF